MTAAPTSRVRAGSPEDILRRAAAVPALDGFPTLDELTERFAAIERAHPDLVTSRRIGTSRLHEPLRAYTIGDGPLSHLIVGGVHPNEPIGSWTALHLLEQLIADASLRESLDATWHIVPCIDPDGMRLNEGWFADPADRATYFREFYRPAGDEQVEWTFPFDYKRAYFDRVMPETLALMRMIDRVQPDLYVPLHNAEMGGVYYYLTRPVPELYDMLSRVPTSLGIPLDRGEPEAGHLTELAPAIFMSGSLEEVYDWTESLGIDPYPEGSGGDASSAYALRYGTLSLIAELPHWMHPDADDTSAADESYAELLTRVGTELAASGTRLVHLLELAGPHLGIRTPFLRASERFVPMLVSSGALMVSRAAQPEAQRTATVAERFGCVEQLHMFRLRFGGMLLRAMRAEVTTGTATAELRRVADETAALLAGWAAEAEDERIRSIPVATLVGVQYGAVLSGAAHLAGAL
ncbi:M14 family zinc carboxypeptidase [Agrococcus sp. Marseille-P2731]|uniref:M14 family zinc carboxypeptidase n=1 Tax=Agrococcus sp. Marseille-P2731 TaxID=1841862 RepID=UPI000B1D7357|nr:M14 family zinc carboxypeptidase [Agrococcus sp. Marseille-P2731]